MSFEETMTNEKKTTYGIVGIILGLIVWGIGHPYIGIMDVVLLIFPCIFLAIPSQTTKNNNALAIISIILLAFAFLVLITGTFYSPGSAILQLILCIYGLFCAFLMRIQTNPQQNTNISNNNEIKYDRYCSKCGQGLFNDSQFCSKCGTNVSIDIPEDSTHDNEEVPEEEPAKEETTKQCSECGQELYEDSKFCPECGTEVTNEIEEDSSPDNEEVPEEEPVEEETTKQCSECGQELYEDSKFCPECGTKVVSSEEEQIE